VDPGLNTQRGCGGPGILEDKDLAELFLSMRNLGSFRGSESRLRVATGKEFPSMRKNWHGASKRLGWRNRCPSVQKGTRWDASVAPRICLKAKHQEKGSCPRPNRARHARNGKVPKTLEKGETSQSEQEVYTAAQGCHGKKTGEKISESAGKARAGASKRAGQGDCGRKLTEIGGQPNSLTPVARGGAGALEATIFYIAKPRAPKETGWTGGIRTLRCVKGKATSRRLLTFGSRTYERPRQQDQSAVQKLNFNVWGGRIVIAHID